MLKTRTPNETERGAYMLARRTLSTPRCHIAYWRWWFGGFKGIALGRLILIAPDADAALVVHEMVHVSQWEKSPWLFYPRYFWRLIRYGYKQHPDEVQAYNFECVARKRLRDLQL